MLWPETRVLLKLSTNLSPARAHGTASLHRRIAAIPVGVALSARARAFGALAGLTGLVVLAQRLDQVAEHSSPCRLLLFAE